jgi:hypothetical protein
MMAANTMIITQQRQRDAIWALAYESDPGDNALAAWLPSEQTAREWQSLSGATAARTPCAPS